jgi:hypothetical protein
MMRDYSLLVVNQFSDLFMCSFAVLENSSMAFLSITFAECFSKSIAGFLYMEFFGMFALLFAFFDERSSAGFLSMNISAR